MPTERDVTVEGKLGGFAGVEDEICHVVSHCAKPMEVEKFVARTGADSLAISIGRSHGAFKLQFISRRHRSDLHPLSMPSR